MIIRKATRKDAAIIAQFFLLAMKDIVFDFIGQKDDKKAFEFLFHFTSQKNNQYSWQNTWVVEDNHKILAAANVYDGAKLYELRSPVTEHLKNQLGRDFTIEDETESGEYYLDCIGVHPDDQGKGIGTKLLLFIINNISLLYQKPLGLLVDEDNPSAKKLYKKVGFKFVKQKQLAGKKMEHMQIKL